jgi:flagellar hook-associated protein 3 FlgL
MQFDPNYISGLVTALNKSTYSEQNLTTELSSGLAVSSLSDNPVAAGESSLLDSSISQDVTFEQTASNTESLMQVTDSTLGAVVTQLTSAISLATEGNGGTESSSDLTSISAQLSSIRDQVVALANTNYQGTYIFAGSMGDVKPFITDVSTTPATTTYNGDPNPNNVNTITTVSGQIIQTSLLGSTVFTAPGANVMTALNNLIADFSNGTVSATAADDISALTDGLTNVSTQRESLDSSLDRLQTAGSYATTDATNRTAAVSALVAANPTTIATQLSAAETQNTSLMDVIATVEKQSLFDHIQ